MSNRIHTLTVIVAAMVCFIAVLAGPGHAQTYSCNTADESRAFFDPCKPVLFSSEIALPLPLELSIVLRPVTVPGKDFWYDQRRLVRLGNPDSPIYEGARLVSISGTFPSRNEDGWLIYMGKYEVSVAQFIAVMGGGDPDKGVEELLERSKATPDGAPSDVYVPLREGLTGAQATSILASPVRGLSYRDYSEFMDRLNDWCYSNEDCMKALPKIDGFPGYVRFPTEEEWEFVARGGLDLKKDPHFNWIDPLPFERANGELYARVSPTSDRRATIIGRYRDIGGFYDLFGNVREITEDRFTSEPGQGRVGGYALRGGGFLDTLDELHAGRREELPVYRLSTTSGSSQTPQMQLSRPSDVGMRIALGAPVIATTDLAENLRASYAEYRKQNRFETGSQKASAPGLTRAADQLEYMRSIAERLSKTPGTANLADQLSSEIGSIEKILDEEAFKNTVNTIEEAAIVAAGAGLVQFRIQKAEGFMEATSEDMRDARERTEARIANFEEQYDNQSAQYVDKVFEIAAYRAFAEDGLEAVKQSEGQTDTDKIAISLVDRHVRELLKGDEDVDRWREDLRTAFPSNIFE